MLVSKKEIPLYIPQRWPMIMVDTLLECAENQYVSQFSPETDNIFNSNGFFNESGLIENMAQTAALGIGYSTVKSNKEVSLGFIGAIKNLRIYQIPKIENLLTTKIDVMHKVLNATVIEANIFIKNELISQGEFKIFINPLPTEK